MRKLLGDLQKEVAMKLQKINKEEYRKKMNLLLVSLVGSLAVFAIVFGTILIDLFGSGQSIAGESTGNFHLNVLGVILSVALNAFIASRVKGHDYLKEAVTMVGFCRSRKY